MSGFTFSVVNNNDVIAVMNEIKSKAVGSDNFTIDMIYSVSFYTNGNKDTY